ncbi:MAG: Gldg family protein [Phycisphaerales bacterium JB063]
MAKPGDNTPPDKPERDAPRVVPSAMQRRLRYGFNVGIAVTAAVGICILLNWLVYRQYRAMSPDSRQWVRYDLTSTRRYSLSEQTRSVLKSLDERHTIVTMLGGADADPAQTQDVHDLVDEYARASGLLEQEHLDLAADTERRAELLGEMAALYADDTRAVRDVLAVGFGLIEGAGDDPPGLLDELVMIQALLQDVIDSEVVTDENTLQFLYQLKSQHDLAQEEYNKIVALRMEQLGERWHTRLTDDGLVSTGEGEDLPDYVLLLAHLQRWQLAIQQELLPTTYNAAQAIRSRIRSSRVDSPELRNRTLMARDKLVQIERLIREPLGDQPSLLNRTVEIASALQVRADQVPQRYNDAREVLSNQACVLVTSETQARVIPAGLLYRGVGSLETTESDAQEQFLGEEQLTGALVSLSLEPPPLVVFIRSNTRRPSLSIGTGAERTLGDYSHVAQRLRAIGIEVADWTYDPHPSKAPTRRPGQRVVWVVVPYAKPMPEHPQTMGQALKASVMAFVQQQLEQGDSALIPLAPNPYANPERRDELLALPGINDAGLADDPILALLSDWGINAQIYRSAYRVISEDSEGRPIAPASPSFTVTQWPQGGVLGQALDGIATYFAEAYPLELVDTPGVTHTPLIEINDPTAWLQDAPGPQQVRGQPLNIPEDAKRESVLVGVAAQRDDARLIVVGDQLWATDGATTLGVMPDGRVMPRLADHPGAYIQYPGNSELFLSSIFWLTENEDLIAASPRTQDIRRVPAITDAAIKRYWVLLTAGMPLAVFLFGAVVWLVRRKA